MPQPLPAPGLFSHHIPSRPTYLHRIFTHALSSANKVRSSDLRISEADLDPQSAKAEADDASLQPRSERDVHLRRLYDLLFVSLSRQDLARCRRVYGILLRSHEWHPAELWRVGLVIAGMLTEDEKQGCTDPDGREQVERAARERKIRFVRRLMQRRSGLRVALVSELIPLLIAQQRYSEASEELELVLTTWPYRQEPLLHLYSGMLILHSASQAAASTSVILPGPSSTEVQAALPRRKRVPTNLEAARHDHDLRLAQSAFESALSAGANKAEAMRRREMRMVGLLRKREDKRESKSRSRSRSRSRGRTQNRPWERHEEGDDDENLRSEESALEDTQMQDQDRGSDSERKKKRSDDESEGDEEAEDQQVFGSTLDDGLAKWAVEEAGAYLDEIIALRQTVQPRASQQGKMLDGLSRASSREASTSASASRGRSRSRTQESKSKGSKKKEEEAKSGSGTRKKRERSASETEQRRERRKKKSKERRRNRPADSPEAIG